MDRPPSRWQIAILLAISMLALAALLLNPPRCDGNTGSFKLGGSVKLFGC